MAHQFDPQVCAEHLSGVVQFATLSNAIEEEMDFSVFFQLHDYLEKAYPLVHATMEREVLGKAALLYHWKGTGKSDKLPLLFMAHLDVVPEGDPNKWTYPPYSGTIADGFVWGRGASDCKSHIICQMEAFEYLISIGFQPDYDIYIAYGYNEEVSGGTGKSAALIAAETLIERGIRIGYSFDEGGSLKDGKPTGCDAAICAISVAEKGYADFEISRRDPGGHSSRPHKDGALDYVARAILAIAENQFPYRLIKPIKERFETLAPHMTKYPELTELMKDMEANWDKIVPIIDKDPELAAFFHTTMVATMAQGSDQANILPEKASIIVNCRLLTGDTLESVQKHIESIVPEGMEVKLLKGNNPSPFSDINTDTARLVEQICRERFGADRDIVLIPDVTVGGTDSKYMYDACEHVYRFGALYKRHKAPGSAHAVNEAVCIEELAEGPQFYVELLTRYDK